MRILRHGGSCGADLLAPYDAHHYTRPSLMNTDDTRLKRLKFRAWRRGFREADLILGPFVDTYGATLTTEQLDALERLLDVPDQDLYEWIAERATTPAEYDGEIMKMLKLFRDQLNDIRGDDRGA